MKCKRHTPEQIIRKLGTAEQIPNHDQTVADVCRALEVFSPLAAHLRRDENKPDQVPQGFGTGEPQPSLQNSFFE